jgi:hypothetical protein
MFTFWNYYVLKLLRLEIIMFSDAALSDINIVLCYVLSQYQQIYFDGHWKGWAMKIETFLALKCHFGPK